MKTGRRSRARGAPRNRGPLRGLFACPNI